jgi:hypothetical protein
VGPKYGPGAVQFEEVFRGRIIFGVVEGLFYRGFLIFGVFLGWQIVVA